MSNLEFILRNPPINYSEWIEQIENIIREEREYAYYIGLMGTQCEGIVR